MSRVVAQVLAFFLLLSGHAYALIPQVSGLQFRVTASLPWQNTELQACIDYLPFAKQAVPTGTNWGSPSYASSTGRCVYPYTSSLGNPNTYSILITQRSATYCPANSTLSGSGCQCNTDYVENAAHTACVVKPVTCTPGQTISGGYFDAGSEVAKGPPYIVCSKGCAAAFDGEFPAGSALIQGKKHYFAKGTYSNTGSNCDSGGGPGIPTGDGNAPSPNDAVPPDSCGPGEAAGVVNGKPVCAPDMSQPGDGTKPPVTPEPPKSDDKKTSETTSETVSNADGSKTTTTTTTTKNVDGTSTTSKTVRTTNSDGTLRSESTITTGSGVTKEAEKEGEDKKAEKCEKNSSDTGCGGDPKAVDANGLYTKKEATVKGALEGAAAKLNRSPVGAAVTGFFVVGGGGSCPSTSANIPFLDKTFTLDFYCSSFAANAFMLLRAVLLLIASWMAFRIAIE